MMTCLTPTLQSGVAIVELPTCFNLLATVCDALFREYLCCCRDISLYIRIGTGQTVATLYFFKLY